MVIDIKMCRFDNVPWGFRLVGGSDFEVPLTVVKVAEGSLAEEAGLRVDDVIVRINDDSTSPMTHDEAHKVISHCGNVFYLGVHRENADEEVEKLFPVSDKLRQLSPSPTPFLNSSNQSEVGDAPSPIPPILKEAEVVLAETDTKAEDEEIASLLGTEAEELKEQTVLGDIPKAGIVQSSEVFRQLKEESTKTRLEIEMEKKKWTTFMQKPDRPIPKSKQQLEAEARAANAYKVKIVKNYKKPEPVRPPSPVPEPEPEPEEEPPKIVTPPPEIEEEPPTDSEVPNLEETEPAGGEQSTSQGDGEEIESSAENVDSAKEASVATEERSGESVDREEKAPSESSSVREKTEEELQLEMQLAEVQKQLLALANLPSAIQSTLDAVTKQLSELLPTFKLPTNISKEATPEVKEEDKKDEEKNDEEKKDEAADESKDIIEKTTVADAEAVEIEETMREVVETEVTQTECVKIESTLKQEFEEKVQVVEVSSRNIEEEQMEEEQNLKRKKENGVIEELQKQIEQKEIQKRKRSKRLFGPLVPQERPLILPGGRRWYRPKDAYNDEFIAETLTAQAELIAGTAVGCKYESPLLGYDERENNCGSVVRHLGKRVNFMKYQKPEKKIDLDKSEVYKVIHHLDRSPVRGIEVRPPVVVAEADVIKVVES